MFEYDDTILDLLHEDEENLSSPEDAEGVEPFMHIITSWEEVEA